jgi:hypothetical protein
MGNSDRIKLRRLGAFIKISEDFWKISDGSRRDIRASGGFLVSPL